MAQVSPRWYASLPATYEPDFALVPSAMSHRLHLSALTEIADRIYVIGRMSDEPYRMTADDIADCLRCHKRTVKKYRRLWELSGMADAMRPVPGCSTASILVELRLPSQRVASPRLPR